MDPDGAIVAERTEPLTVQTPHPYWSEQDPETWWQATIDACAALGAKHDPGAVQGIGLSGQMHGAVLLDAGNAVIRPAILWNDGRSHAECAALAQAVPAIGELSGAPPLPGFTAPKLLWMAKHEPEAHARIAHILLPKDYVGLRLHGQHVTDPSDAAGTMWLDQARRAWSEDLARASSVSPDWLPRLCDGTEIVGTLTHDAASALGLLSGIPIVAGGGDAASGAVSVGAITDGACFLSLGTSGQLFTATRDYRPNPAQMVHAYAHTVPDMWFQMAAMLNGARPMAWFAEVCDADVAALLTEAGAVDAVTAPLFLPYLTGERSPHGDPHIRGAFYGLADGMGRAEMMRGVLNAIAFSFADAADSLRASGTQLGDILAIGGGARSDLLLQTIADVLGTPVGRGAAAHAGPALGAARLAACASGALSLGDLARRPAVEHRFEPNPARHLNDKLHGYRRLYQRLKGIHNDLEGSAP